MSESEACSPTCPPLPHAFYTLLISNGMPEGMQTGEQHAWLYRHLVHMQDINRRRIWAEEITKPLERLRENEGSFVTIFCDNPDFNGQPDRAIEVTDDWTDWTPRRFEGNSLSECFDMAEKAKKARSVK